MSADEFARISTALEKADPETIREIVREAESFLAAQLQAGLAADSRAMTFAGILAAIVSFLIGGTASLIAANIPIWPHIGPVFVVAVSLCAALSFAIHAARPTLFGYAGNDPQNWIADVEGSRSLTASLAGQAALYSNDIRDNAKVLEENHKSLRRALLLALGGTAAGLFLEFILVLVRLGRTGFIF